MKKERKIFFIDRNDLKLLRRAFSYVKPHKLLFFATFVAIIFSMVLELVHPILYGQAIDHILDKNLNLVVQTILIIFGVTITNSIFSLLETYLTDLLGNKIVLDIKQDLYHHILNLPIKLYDQLRVGEIISRLEGDVDALSNIITYQAMRLVLDVARIIGIGFVIFRINVTLSWIIVCTFPLTYLIVGWFGKILRRKGETFRRLNDHYYSFLAESFTGIKEVKALHIEKVVKNKFMAWANKLFKMRIRMDLIGGLSGLASMGLGSVTSLLVMGVGGYYIIGGVLSMGMYISFNRFSGQFNRALGNIAGMNATIQKAMVSLERIFALIDNFMLPPEKREGVVPEEIVGQLQFDQVTFGYNAEESVLQDIDFAVPANQMTALVGASGSGKTTLFNLLLRFYYPEKGQIRLDGQPIDELHLDYLREKIAIVSQEPFLFNLSIRENLLLASPDVTEEEMVVAAKKAYIHQFVATLPEGYDTVVGERGTRLSGGQKQRLAIARAILKGSQILLFDEATSALDGEAEEYIQQVLQELLVDHTVLVIAHRLSTVIHAENIVVISEGEVVGQGTHAELIRGNLVYRRLYQSQWNSYQNRKLD